LLPGSLFSGFCSGVLFRGAFRRHILGLFGFGFTRRRVVAGTHGLEIKAVAGNLAVVVYQNTVIGDTPQPAVLR
jgi:hypothetical protein